jgi:pimeloyl-ACP methyl ester carboxylesterase
LFYKDWGNGRPMVFIAGWGLGADMWEYQMTALAERGLRCIAYDRRGSGRSSQPGGGYDFDTLSEDLAEILEHLDLRAATLVGFSMGGGELARYLARHGSGRVAGAVLLSSVTPFLLRTADNPDGVDPAYFDATVAALAQDRPKLLADTAPAFFGLPNPAVSPAIVEWGIGLALQTSLKAAIDTVRAFSSTDFRADLAAFTVPTLVIHGDRDQNVPLELTARRSAAAIRGSRLSVYEGAPHALFFTEKERLNRELLAFAP